MRIEPYERVEYQNNPLAEVVCQLRFEKLADFSDAEKTAIRAEFSGLGYTNHREEATFAISLQIGPDRILSNNPVAPQQVRIQHFESADTFWRASISSNFIALTCTKYTRWNDFLPRLLIAARTFLSRHSEAVPLRLGLRYRDVIEREALGLEGVPWHSLIQPFLLGPLAPNALAESETAREEEVSNFLSQSLLRLDNATVLLQSSLLLSADGKRRAFLIDADFFNEGDLEHDLLLNSEVLASRLEVLHARAGALFRRGITQELHNALRPRT